MRKHIFNNRLINLPHLAKGQIIPALPLGEPLGEPPGGRELGEALSPGFLFLE